MVRSKEVNNVLNGVLSRALNDDHECNAFLTMPLK